MSQRKKILVIDDDAEDCALISRTLEPCGLEIVTRLDARAGVEAAEALRPDLIFIKLLLPGTNGLKVSKAIHSVETLRHVPLVVIVSEQGELDPKYTTTIGIVDILVQPLRSSEIIAQAIARLGEEAVMCGEDAMAEEWRDEEEVFHVAEDEPAFSVSGTDEGDFGEPLKYEKETTDLAMPVTVEDGEASMPGHRNLQDAEEQDLFSRMGGHTEGKEATEFRDAGGLRRSSVFSEGEEDRLADPDDADSAASPVRRAVIVIASIASGIAVGIGGYLFFTAGTRQAPVQKEIREVMPGPAAVSPDVPASPPARQKAIPEIPVKQEPMPQTEKSSSAVPSAPAAPAGPQAKTTPDAGHTGGYIVQAGVFEKKENANALAVKITGMGVNAVVIKVDGAGGKTVYRVTAGVFATRAEAVTASDDLKRKGFATIVRKQ